MAGNCVNRSKHARDPRLAGIRRHSQSRQRYEARIAGGRSGVWIYVGLFVTMEQAIQARDNAKRRRRA